MGKVISVILQKGGVGKTTTSAVLLKELSENGYRVLGIDLDAQCQFTAFAFGIDDLEEDSSNMFKEQNIYNAFLEGSLLDNIITVNDYLDFVPSSSLLYDEDSMFEERDKDIQSYLKDMLDEVIDDYDFVIIDTSPKLYAKEENAIVASDYLLIPVQPEKAAVVELKKFLTNKFDVYKKLINPKLEILGVFATQADNRISGHAIYRKEIIKLCGDTFIPGYVKRKVSVTKVLDYGLNKLNEENETGYVDEYRRVLHRVSEKLDVKFKSLDVKSKSVKKGRRGVASIV